MPPKRRAVVPVNEPVSVADEQEEPNIKRLRKGRNKMPEDNVQVMPMNSSEDDRQTVTKRVTKQPKETKKEPMEKETVKKETAKKDKMKKERVKKEVVEKETAENGSVKKEKVKKQLVEKEMVKKDTVKKQKIVKEPSQNEIIEKKKVAKNEKIPKGKKLKADNNDVVVASKVAVVKKEPEDTVTKKKKVTKAKVKTNDDKDEPVETNLNKGRKKMGLSDNDDNETPGTSQQKSGGQGKENSDTTNVKSKSKAIDRKVIVKGRAAVDALCPNGQMCHVFCEGDDVWDCMLNQTNIQNNNNKYFLIQLLKDDTRESYSVWMRWGRVGCNGQKAHHQCASDLGKAKTIFMKKFNDKTKNDWDERDCFEKVPGKYDLLKMDYSKGSDDVTDGEVEKIKKKTELQKIECHLEVRVRSLIELVCDIRVMEEAVIEMKYDARKAPLGKLTDEQIRSGYLALKRIDEIITAGGGKQGELLQACNDFYTRIPHYFGMKVPPMIRNSFEVREKLNLLEALGDIQAALSVLGQSLDSNLHPVDSQYKSLACHITSIESTSPEFQMLERYLQSTHAHTHIMYSLEVQQLFSVRKDLEYERFRDVGNRRLLWHGSRLSNWAGILSQGLRIAPPEAPSTGYMFGKGIYFADMSSKSANYCMATRQKDVGLLVLSEVALGNFNDLYNADYNAHRLPKGCQSVRGLGKVAPSDGTSVTLPDGVVVPMGPGVDRSKGGKNYSLQYNEYIVYDPAQVRARYLMKVKFNFKN